MRSTPDRPRRLGLAIAIAALAALGTKPDRAAGTELLVVAWDDPPGIGQVAGLSLAPPYELDTPTLPVGADGRVRAGFGRVLHLSRASGSLRVVDPASWSVERVIPIAASLSPRDVMLVSASEAWVSCASSSGLLRANLDDGSLSAAVDLSPLGVGDGSPVMESMLLHEGRLYVQLSGSSVFPPDPHLLAVIDVASETLVDADPVRAGIQGIALQGTAPRFKMQVVPDTDHLLLSATGDLSFDGGLELVDLVSLQSLGIPIPEFEGATGNDVGAFALLNADRGWLVFATDIVLSSHLHPFTLSAGTEIFEAATSLFYFAPHLVYDAVTDTLFWPEPGGVEAFDAQSGISRGFGPTPLGGPPTDLELLRIPAVPSASHPARALLVLIALLPTLARYRSSTTARPRARTQRGGRRTRVGTSSW